MSEDERERVYIIKGLFCLTVFLIALIGSLFIFSSGAMSKVKKGNIPPNSVSEKELISMGYVICRDIKNKQNIPIKVWKKECSE